MTSHGHLLLASRCAMSHMVTMLFEVVYGRRMSANRAGPRPDRFQCFLGPSSTGKRQEMYDFQVEPLPLPLGRYC